jgi:hypothetical protein
MSAHETHLVRIIFRFNGVERPHVLPRDQLSTSEFLTSNLRKRNGKPMSDLRLSFDLRDVTPMWHFWVLNREILPDYFLPYQHEKLTAMSKDCRAQEDYFDLLVCLCLSHKLVDATFENAIMTKLVQDLRNGGDATALLRCFQPKVVKDIFSMFDNSSSVRAFIVNATVSFATIGDIIFLINNTRYEREYITAVTLRAFEEMLRFKFGDPATESARPFMAPKVEKKPRSWELAVSRLKPQAVQGSSTLRK